jgi:hypothetical protein
MPGLSRYCSGAFVAGNPRKILKKLTDAALYACHYTPRLTIKPTLSGTGCRSLADWPIDHEEIKRPAAVLPAGWSIKGRARRRQPRPRPAAESGPR